MTALPQKLIRLLEMLRLVEDRQQRIDLLIDLSDRYRGVPHQIATRPYPKQRLVPHCESEAYFWKREREDGTLDFHFAVENPQGISAMAMAAILTETCSGAPLEAVAEVTTDVVYEIFGRELSMGKTMGLTGMAAMVKQAAVEKLAEAPREPQRK